ncbi:MAG: hypothetical protein R3B13_00420 [Polyangiaceae bacterium]
MGARKVDSGVELVARLRAERATWLVGSGELEDVALRVASTEGSEERALKGRWTLASLQGPGGGPFTVTLARVGDNGISVVAGELLRATSRGVSLIAMGAALESAPEVPEGDDEPDAPRWSDRARQHVAEPEEDEPLWPEAGDLVEHFAFGLCDVLMASDDRLKIRDKNGPGRIREIRAEMLTVHPPTSRDGKRLFRLERKH